MQSFSVLHHRITGINSITVKGIEMKFCKKCQVETERYKCGKCAPCSRASCAHRCKANREKARESSAAWRKANPERKKESDAAWRKLNPDRVKSNNAAWHKANKEKANAKSKAWGKANLEKKVAYNAAWRIANLEKSRLSGRIRRQNRRARMRDNGGKLSQDIADKLFKLQHGRCACCGNPLGNDYHLDHRMPLALGGANEDWNMQLLRKRCNLQKQSKHPVDFMQSRGFLL